MATFQAAGSVNGQDNAEENTSRAGLKFVKRTKETIVFAPQVFRSGHVNPIDGASGVRDREIRHPYKSGNVPRLIHRPFRERAVAEVITDEHIFWDRARETRDGPREALPCAVSHPWNDAFDIEHFIADVPLKGEVGGRNRRSQPF